MLHHEHGCLSALEPTSLPCCTQGAQFCPAGPSCGGDLCKSVLLSPVSNMVTERSRPPAPDALLSSSAFVQHKSRVDLALRTLSVQVQRVFLEIVSY